MKKVSIKAAEPRPEADKAKRVYRTAVETIRRLDELVKQKRAYRDVFMPDAISLRGRLQDLCERLMFYDPLEYGRKAEELLWRKVYYDVIQLMKHNRKQMRPSSSLEGAFRTHLAAATGYYHHLLCRLQAEYNLNLDGIVDYFFVSEPKAFLKPQQAKKSEPEGKVKEWAEKACHRCLVYLGDIARYQQDYDGMRSRVLSQRYYYQALLLCPCIGMPHNQLGTLAGARYYNLDAAYYYMRCMVCENPFEGAHGNLTRLIEKNRRRHSELGEKSPRDLPPEQQRSKDIKRFIVRFVHLLDIFHSQSCNIDSKGIQESCQAALQDFNLCMFYQPPHVTNPGKQAKDYYVTEKLSYIQDDMVFKIIVICMITIHILQKEGNKRVTAAIAFSLALFSHILNHVMIRLQSALYEIENPRKILDIVDSTEDNRLMATTDLEESKPVKKKHGDNDIKDKSDVEDKPKDSNKPDKIDEPKPDKGTPTAEKEANSKAIAKKKKVPTATLR